MPPGGARIRQAPAWAPPARHVDLGDRHPAPRRRRPRVSPLRHRPMTGSGASMAGHPAALGRRPSAVARLQHARCENCASHVLHEMPISSSSCGYARSHLTMESHKTAPLSSSIYCFGKVHHVVAQHRKRRFSEALPFLTYFPLSLRLDYFGDGNGKSLRTVG